MLGLTELLAPEHTCTVAANIIDLRVESCDNQIIFKMKHDKSAFKFKPGKSAVKLKDVKSPVTTQSAKPRVQAQPAKPAKTPPKTPSAESAVEMKAAKSAAKKESAKTTKCKLNCFDVLGSRAASKVPPTPDSVRPCYHNPEKAVTLRTTDPRKKPAYKAVWRTGPFALHGGVRKKVRNTHLIFVTP